MVTFSSSTKSDFKAPIGGGIDGVSNSYWKHQVINMRIGKYLIFIFVVYLIFPSFLQALTPMHEYTQAIEDCPEDMKYKFYLLRGKVHKDSGSLESALQDLSASISLHPSIKAYG